MITATTIETYKILPTEGLDEARARVVHRLNGLGSLFYFTKVVLRRRRLTPQLHYGFCRSFERPHLKDVIAYPRDHFKSTICSEGLPMWWALPLSENDINEFKKIGYSDDFIRFMQRVHDPNTRTLLVSENLTNATKLGGRIRWHFESNSVYRTLYPETLPTSAEMWTSASLHVRRPGTGGSHGEGTFDFLGVGGALQSRHYKRVVEDDLVGRKAIESQSVMDKTIDYHRLLVGAFESEDAVMENDQIVVGNRWGYNDLFSWIEENEPHYRFEAHSAMGGCCAEHPADTPILPTEFSMEKLLKFKKTLGPYLFSCQFLNSPMSPEDADFKVEWLRHFEQVTNSNSRQSICHEVKDGEVMHDLPISFLSIAMAVDPNHSGNAGAGRARHAIVVVGLSDAGNFYLLDYWAQHASYDTLFDKIYRLAEKWHLRQIGVETIAAQNLIKYHLEKRNYSESNPLKIVELKGEVDAPDGTPSRKKEWRIRSLEPIFSRGNFWCRRNAHEFIAEYQNFPRGKTVDILDALAYIPDMLKHHIPYERHMTMLQKNRARVRQLNQPYSVGGHAGLRQ